MGWPLVLATQVTLGMYTIWTQKAADVATAHVAVGATSLVWGVLTYAALRRWMASGVIESNAQLRCTSGSPNGGGGRTYESRAVIDAPPSLNGY